ncbi:MAG: hypothetical protein PF693_17710 [Spirochaetia bacterium]|jgi:hypothetical protein|nr:hypothetical protein [Spirochaetia bacterium]
MIKFRKLFFILFILLTSGLFSQAILLPSEEAPESIFSISPGGADVDLYLLGTWETELLGGYGISWNSENKDLIESSFPGMQTGLQLTHGPDIFISLWLMNSYFFEASFIDDYDLNTILFGYEALEENFLRSVRIGNTDIGFGDYSYLSIPEASTDSMGGMALFKNDKSEHQLMLRYDPAEMQVKNFIGQYEVDPSRAKLTEYIKGRYFILPDDNVEDLKVYIEDSSGIYSGTATYGTSNYRLATSDDAIMSAEEGIVFFRASLNKRAAVYYTKNSNPVGDTTLGLQSLVRDSDGLSGSDEGKLDITGTDQFQFGNTDKYFGIDMDSWALSIDSGTALIIYEPGVFSPFEMLSVYSLPYLLPDNPALFNATLADINLSTGENVNFSTTFEDYMVRVLYNGDSYRDPANRYPLATSIDTNSLIYEPDKELSGTPSDKELLFQRLFPVGSYYLGDNVLDGSVSVNFNGFDEYRYTFNPDSGTVNFLFPVPADAQIEISYRTMVTTGMSGDLLLALGSKFNFSDNFFMETGVGLRWNVLDSSYIEKPGDASGSIMGTAGLSYTGEKFDFKIDAGISVHSPNTTGILRLAGMNKSGFSVPLSANLLYPSAPSTSGIITGTRGILYYKDFHEYDTSGSSTLNDYTWTPPADQIYSYEDGGRTGPYIAGSNSEIEGNIAVIDYSLGNTEWTGGRIPITLGSMPLDLSSSQALSLKWKHISTTGSIDIYVRAGKLAEDLDDDSILDKESSIYESGFNFNDGLFNMKVGLSPDSSAGNEQLDTEDLDGNSILDGEGSNLIFTKSFTGVDGNWETLTIDLTPPEREQLKAVTGFEIIIVENAALTATGQLLIGDITFSGSSFVTKPDTGQLVTAKEINELYSSAPTPLLTTSYPEVSIFSSGTGAQNVAEINWNNAGDWEATTFTEAVDLSDYNKISFYMKTPDILKVPTDISFSLTNPSGNGISLRFTPIPGTTNWIKYTADYRNNTLTADGNIISVIEWGKRDFNAKNANRLTLLASCTSITGTLLFDEVHLEDPVVGISGAANTSFNFRQPGTILDYKDIAILSNFNFSNSSGITGQNFGSGFTNDKDTTIYTSTDLAVSLMAMRIDSKLNLQWQETELFASPAISFTVPFLENRVIINDSYSEINLPLSESTLRDSSITTNLGSSSFLLSAGSTYSLQNLTRNWGISSTTSWDKGSLLAGSADFRMSSNENPYENMNSLEKFSQSYLLFLPGDVQNDRFTNLSIKPTIKLNRVTFGIEESLGSSVSGIDERILNTSQMISTDAKFIFNPESLKEWNLIPSYKKTISSLDKTDTDTNFYTDLRESILKMGTHKYYFKGIPLWEIFYPNFGDQFIKDTVGLRNTVYSPGFSLEFSRLEGSRPFDIFLPSAININLSRELIRDFDSVTDNLKINLETRATALNVFGKLGTTPLTDLYQTEEITNIFSIGGDYRSYMTDFFNDPVFNLNYSLYLNFSLSQKSSAGIQSSHNWSWIPLTWNSSSTAYYNWLIIPDKMIKVPLLYEENSEDKPYFEHTEKLTISSSNIYEQNENSITFTVNHSTDLIFTDKGNISFFAGIGFDQKNITNTAWTKEYYMLGVEVGISAKITF